MYPILTLTNSRHRVVYEAFADADGTYHYRADGAGGWGLTYEDILQRALDHTEYNRSARPTAGRAVDDYNTLLASVVHQRSLR